MIRITPAGAGKTGVLAVASSCAKDHPRRCGENAEKEHYSRHQQGSPPQVRGKPYGLAPKFATDRITPAGAGKTKLFRLFDTFKRDHPRRCGENNYITAKEYAHSGSPPQVRGKPLLSSCFVVVQRITPAGAGKTSVPLSLSG